MLRNYITIALRSIRKEKLYAFINILGLAIGMAATILLVLFVRDEFSYDDYNQKADRLYRVSREWLNDKKETSLHLGHCAPPFGPLLKNDFEGLIEETARIGSGNSPLISYKDKSIEEQNFYIGDESVFSVFTWPLIEGDPETALTEPSRVVITESAAARYFGKEDPMGKTILYKNYGQEIPLKVTGIAIDIPDNSHIHWDFMASFATLEMIFGRENLMHNWGSNNYATYVLLEPGKKISDLEAGIPGFLDDHLGDFNGNKASETNRLHFMPVTDIHLYSHLDSEVEDNSNIIFIYIYSIIAAFIVLIACVNFMNLATARSAKRAREVGLRKVMGAFRFALIKQFITESLLYALFGCLLACIIVWVSLPYFNDFVQKHLRIDLTGDLFLSVFLVAVILVIGLLAGSYPAFYLSHFVPAEILKGGHKSPGRKINLRSLLVVFQFMIALILIIGVGIVNDQLRYVKTKDLGLNKSNVMVLPSNDKVYENFANLKGQFERQSGIVSVSLASRVPSGRLLDSQGASAEVGQDMVHLSFRIADVHVAHNYLSSLGIPVIAGRDFDPDRASDSTHAFILNKAAVERIGWTAPDDAIGKSFEYGDRKGVIIGVTDDFHFESLHQQIAPIVFMITSGRASSVLIRYKPGEKDSVLAYLREQWTYIRPGFPFDYYEIDEHYAEQYNSEERLSKIVAWFSGLAIVIAALGLFGLASFMAEQRIKEIGIRKVLGAGVGQLLVLLGKGFTWLILIAMMLATPLAYWAMEQWLDVFAYAGTIKPGPFLIAILFGLGIAWATISFQLWKAVRSNPVEALRNE